MVTTLKVPKDKVGTYITSWMTFTFSSLLAKMYKISLWNLLPSAFVVLLFRKMRSKNWRDPGGEGIFFTSPNRGLTQLEATQYCKEWKRISGLRHAASRTVLLLFVTCPDLLTSKEWWKSHSDLCQNLSFPSLLSQYLDTSRIIVAIKSCQISTQD